MPTTTLPVLQQKFADTRTSMKRYLFERDDEIDIFLLCLAGRLNAFFKGTPGIAKTFTVETGIKHIDGLGPNDFFRILVGGYTTDAEFFGDRDLAAMDRNERRRVLDKTLVLAKIAAIDEVFNANNSALNSLLTILNEGKFDNGTDGTVESPLFATFTMSNHFPKSEDLAALADRLHLWKIVSPTREDGNFIEVLKSQTLPAPTPTITLADIEAAQVEVDKVEIDEEVYGALARLRRDLYAEGVEPTDRRFALTLRAIRAWAWLHGQTVATVEDMLPIRWMLWKRPEDITKVDKAVFNLASQIEADARDLDEIADSLAEDVEKCLQADNERAKNQMAMEVHTNLQQLTSDVHTLDKRVQASGRPSATVDKLKQRVDSLMIRIVRDGFGIDPNTGKALGQ